MILTDKKGHPIPDPGPPPPRSAGIEATVEWLRARAIYRDAISDTANNAFAQGLSEGLKDDDGVVEVGPNDFVVIYCPGLDRQVRDCGRQCPGATCARMDEKK